SFLEADYPVTGSILHAGSQQMRENVDNPSELRNTPLRRYLIRRSAGIFSAATFDAESLAQGEHKGNCEIIYQIMIPRPKPVRYRTTNWSAYNAALRKRGSLLIW